jgi:hypothetical protein
MQGANSHLDQVSTNQKPKPWLTRSSRRFAILRRARLYVPSPLTPSRRQLQNDMHANTLQDFEGQRLSELLATVVLAVVGVRVPGSLVMGFTNYYSRRLSRLLLDSSAKISHWRSTLDSAGPPSPSSSSSRRGPSSTGTPSRGYQWAVQGQRARSRRRVGSWWMGSMSRLDGLGGV